MVTDFVSRLMFSRSTQIAFLDLSNWSLPINNIILCDSLISTEGLSLGGQWKTRFSTS